MAPAQVNQSIVSGFDILQDVISAGTALGSREVARRMNMEHSRANRILGTLAAAGMLQQTADSKYIPGPGLHALSALSLHASGLLPAALPVLEGLHRQGATVALGTLWRDTIVYLLHANPNQDLAHSAGAHENYPKEKSVLSRVLDADTENCCWIDTEGSQERAFAARIGNAGSMAIAAVFPLDHPSARKPEETLRLVRQGAEQIRITAQLG